MPLVSLIRRLPSICAGLATCLALSACVLPPPQMEVTAGDTARLAAAGRYSWTSDVDAGGGDIRLASDELRGRFRKAIDRALAKKGYSAQPSGAPVLVTYHISLQDRTTYSSSTKAGPTPGAVCTSECLDRYHEGDYGTVASTGPNVVDYRDGTVILELTDAATGDMLWRGVSQTRVPPTAADQSQLDALLGELTEQLPPAGR